MKNQIPAGISQMQPFPFPASSASYMHVQLLAYAAAWADGLGFSGDGKYIA